MFFFNYFCSHFVLTSEVCVVCLFIHPSNHVTKDQIDFKTIEFFLWKVIFKILEENCLKKLTKNSRSWRKNLVEKNNEK